MDLGSGLARKGCSMGIDCLQSGTFDRIVQSVVFHVDGESDQGTSATFFPAKCHTFTFLQLFPTVRLSWA